MIANAHLSVELEAKPLRDCCSCPSGLIQARGSSWIACPCSVGAIRHRSGTHLLEQQGAAHEALVPESAVGTEGEGLGPAPAQGTGDYRGLLGVGVNNFNIVESDSLLQVLFIEREESVK